MASRSVNIALLDKHRICRDGLESLLKDVDGTFTLDPGVDFILPWEQVEGVIWDTSSFGTDGTITLTAVPEPAACALLLGLLALSLGVTRRRR